MLRRLCILTAAGIVCLCSAGTLRSDEGKPLRSAVELTAQRRDESGRAVSQKLTIDPPRTAVVVVDMWDRHWCKTYTARVGNMVPRMNRTLAAARKLGIQVVFAPSDVVAFYKDYPQRKAMQAIPQQPVPGGIEFNPPGPPGGRDCCECGPDRPCKHGAVWSRQQKDLRIAEGDLIADCNNGRELLNLCGGRGIDTLVYMGVASNMCVLNRSCGIINMKRHGLRAVVVGDLVEAITANRCDPATKQKDLNFTPAKGSARVQRYLEQHVAPTIESRQVITAAGMDPHADDRRPHVVFVIAEQEYDSQKTLPAFAAKYLAGDFRSSFVLAKGHQGEDRHDVPGLEALYDADLLVLSMRRRALPVVQMDHLERYIRSGKPMVGIRVSIVPFQVSSAPPGHVIWSAFDREVLGCHYRGYAAESRQSGCDVWVLPEAADHPILKGVQPAKFHSRCWLYKLRPLAETVTPLMAGRWSAEGPTEPVAWTNTYHGGRVFYTSLGHPDDFKLEPFNRLLLNGIRWALDRAGTND